ncbi:unnamed protein product, partial [Brassica oleracea]
MMVWEGYVSDETMGTIAPIIVYWVYAGVNQFISPSLDNGQRSLASTASPNLNHPIRIPWEGNLKANGPTLSTNPDPSDINSHVHIRHVSVLRPPLHAPQQVPLSDYHHVHSHHHRLVVPNAVGALYNHPVEVISDMLGGAAAFFASGMTPRTSVWFFCLVTVKTVDDHCGLRIPGNLFHVLFKNNSAYHDIHHQVNGVKYNYSQPFFTFWDRVMGTYMPYHVMKRPRGGFDVRMMKK